MALSLSVLFGLFFVSLFVYVSASSNTTSPPTGSTNTTNSSTTTAPTTTTTTITTTTTTTLPPNFFAGAHLLLYSNSDTKCNHSTSYSSLQSSGTACYQCPGVGALAIRCTYTDGVYGYESHLNIQQSSLYEVPCDFSYPYFFGSANGACKKVSYYSMSESLTPCYVSVDCSGTLPVPETTTTTTTTTTIGPSTGTVTLYGDSSCSSAQSSHSMPSGVFCEVYKYFGNVNYAAKFMCKDGEAYEAANNYGNDDCTFANGPSPSPHLLSPGQCVFITPQLYAKVQCIGAPSATTTGAPNNHTSPPLGANAALSRATGAGKALLLYTFVVVLILISKACF